MAEFTNAIAAPIAVHVGGWLACAFFIVAGWNQAQKFFDRYKEQPPPAATYQVKGDYVARSEFLLTQGQMKHDIEAVYRKIDDLKTDGSRRGREVHERINIVLAAVSELKGIVQRNGRP